MAVLKFPISSWRDRHILKAKYNVSSDISESSECTVGVEVIDNTKDLKIITLNGTKWTMQLPFYAERDSSPGKSKIWSDFLGGDEVEFTVGRFSRDMFFVNSGSEEIAFRAMYTLRFKTLTYRSRCTLRDNFNAEDVDDDDAVYAAYFEVLPDVGGCKAVNVNGITFVTNDYASLGSNKRSTWASMEAGKPQSVDKYQSDQFSVGDGFGDTVTIDFQMKTEAAVTAMRLEHARHTASQALRLLSST